MAHFRLMAKADRDQTEARLAEAELKEFLLKYPDNPSTARVKGRLREAQEVLAQGEFETASFYQMRGAYRAARGRYKDIVEKYPNFSRGDQALYGMGQTLEHLKVPKEAVPYYSRLVRDFPRSPRVPEAKDRLVAMGQPVPKPTRATLARAEADAARVRSRSLLQKLGTAMASTPDTSATLRGPVQIGGAEAGGVEMAKRAPTLPSAAIIAGPVSDTSLNSGKAVDAEPGSDLSNRRPSANPQDSMTSSSEGESRSKAPDNKVVSSTTESSSKAPDNKAVSSTSESSSKSGEGSASSAPQEQSGNTTPAKKKSRFHILKKIVKPI
jgi:outer membrane protein assembly factor BamD